MKKKRFFDYTMSTVNVFTSMATLETRIVDSRRILKYRFHSKSEEGTGTA